MKLILFLLLALVQFTIPRRGGIATAPLVKTWAYVDAKANFGCTAGTTACTVTGLTSTTANSVLLVSSGMTSGFAGNITSASGGGGTWTLCPSTTCYGTLGGIGTLDQAYNITGTGGATSVTVNVATAPGATWFATVSEWKCTANCGTGPVLDNIGSIVQTSTCTTCSASSFTLTSTDLCTQVLTAGGAPGAPSSPYTVDTGQAGYGGYYFIYDLATTSGAAPTVTQTSSYFISTGMCFK